MPGEKHFAVLVLEDDKNEQDRLTRNFKEFCKGKDVVFDLQITSNADEAETALRDRYFDCAILDLRVPKSADGKAEIDPGSKLAAFALNGFPLPVVFNTAIPKEVPADLKRFPVKVVEKEGGKHQEIYDWMTDLVPLMSAVRATSEQIREKIADVFTGSIWRHWKDTKARKLTEQQLNHVITRHVTSYVYEQLALPDQNTPPFSLHEFYYIPPLRERVHTGDLLERNGKTFVVLSPQCDMVRQYPEEILVAECDSLEEWKGLKATIGSADAGKEKKEKARRQVQDFANQNIEISRHFLPPCDDKGPWLANFKKLSTIPSKDADVVVKDRFASISAQFVPHLVQRFSTHLGRIGQPALDLDNLIAV